VSKLKAMNGIKKIPPEMPGFIVMWSMFLKTISPHHNVGCVGVLRIDFQ